MPRGKKKSKAAKAAMQAPLKVQPFQEKQNKWAGWKTLEHLGPAFQPPYEPHGVPILYEGREVKLTPEEEEAATCFAADEENQQPVDDVFRENFFKSWKAILDKRPEGRAIVNLRHVDFTAIREHLRTKKAQEEAMSPEEKRLLKEARAAKYEQHKWVLHNGRKVKISHPRVENPGLFRGNGKHPKRGMWRPRIHPEDVTVNVQDVNNPPRPPEGHQWGKVISDNRLPWIACWPDVILKTLKCLAPDKNVTEKKADDLPEAVLIADEDRLLEQPAAERKPADVVKIKRALTLADVIDEVREEYEKGFKSEDKKQMQMSVAMYFIDRLALHVGGRDEDVDAIGCCSLYAEDVRPFHMNVDGMDEFFVHFELLGRDSVRYASDLPVSEEVHHLVVRLCEGKDSRRIAANRLFDAVAPADLEAHIASFMPGLTAAMFRAYNGPSLLEQVHGAPSNFRPVAHEGPPSPTHP